MEGRNRVLATGTTGLIGTHLQNVIPMQIDLLDAKSFSEILGFPGSTLIHLAGIVGLRKVEQDVKRSFEVNVEGTRKLGEFIRENSDLRILVVSSSHVYKPSLGKLKETDALEPINIYGEQKLMAEQLMLDIFSDCMDRLLIARVFSVLDKGMPKGTLGWAIENLDERNPLNWTDDVRDFLTPPQIAKFLLELADIDFGTNIINVCSGEGSTVWEACISLRNSLGRGTPQELLKPGHSKVPSIVGNNSLLKQILSRNEA